MKLNPILRLTLYAYTSAPHPEEDGIRVWSASISIKRCKREANPEDDGIRVDVISRTASALM